MFVSQVIESSNAIAFRRAAGELNEGCWGRSTLLFCISACNNYVVHARVAEFLKLWKKQVQFM